MTRYFFHIFKENIYESLIGILFFKVWDLRSFGGNNSEPVAAFSHHTGAITGLEWHRDDSTVFASCGADDQVLYI